MIMIETIKLYLFKKININITPIAPMYYLNFFLIIFYHFIYYFITFFHNNFYHHKNNFIYFMLFQPSINSKKNNKINITILSYIPLWFRNQLLPFFNVFNYS